MRTSLNVIAVFVALTGVASAQMQGRVIMSGAERPGVVVRVESESGQIVDQAFTSARGNFSLDVTSIDANNPLYLVIVEEGYKPVRQFIRQGDLRGGLAALTIFLERKDALVAQPGTADGNVTVDVQQIQIPAAATREYEAALQDSDRGNHQRAATRLEQAVALAPAYYDAWINLGRQYEHLARFEESLRAYTEANRVNSGDMRAALNLGAFHYQQGERQRVERNVAAIDSYLMAENWLRQTISLAPKSAEAHFYLGSVWHRVGRYSDAEQMLQNALTLQPDYADAQLMLINVYTRQNLYEAALKQAVAFLQAYPRAPERDAIERVRSQLEQALGR